MIRGQLPDDTDISDTHNEQAIMLPLSAAYYNNHLLMSMYWTQQDLEKYDSVLTDQFHKTVSHTQTISISILTNCSALLLCFLIPLFDHCLGTLSKSDI